MLEHSEPRYVGDITSRRGDAIVVTSSAVSGDRNRGDVDKLS
jgi:hypothetical protein